VNYRKLPASIIGLSLITFALMTVVFVKGTTNVDAKNKPFPTDIAYTKSSNEQTTGLRKVQKSIFAGQSTTEKVESLPTECSLTARDLSLYAFKPSQNEFSLTLDPKENFSITVEVENTGQTAWCGEQTYNLDLADANVYKTRLATSRNADHASVFLDGNPYRVSLKDKGLVMPGEKALFTLTGAAPQTPGIYREYFQPIVEGLDRFGEGEIQIDLYVGEYNSVDLEKLYYLKQSGNTGEIDLASPLRILVDLEDQKEYVIKGNKLINSYLVSSGAYDSPTPVGKYKTINKQELRIGGKAPHYRMPWWIGLKRDTDRAFIGYGLHGLPYLGNVTVDNSGKIVTKGNFWQEAVNHLGTRVSHGCVRRADDEAEWLWKIVDIDNTTVEVMRSFDEANFHDNLYF